MKYYAICDCDNCYVSCERVFRPDLEGKPVVVLRRSGWASRLARLTTSSEGCFQV